MEFTTEGNRHKTSDCLQGVVTKTSFLLVQINRLLYAYSITTFPAEQV